MNLQEYEINEQLLSDAINNGMYRAKRVRPVRRAAVILVALVAISAVAVATGYFSGIIGWNGQIISENGLTIPLPSATPTVTEYTELEATEEYVNALMDEKPDFEYWIVRYGDGSARLGMPSESFDSLAQGAGRIRESGLRIPISPPTGYEFIKLSISFYFTEQDVKEISPFSQEAKDHGITLERYVLPERVRSQIKQYTLTFGNNSGKSIIISAICENSAWDGGFGVWDDMTYEVVDVTGMDGALYLHINNNASSTLFMKQNGAPLHDHVISPIYESVHVDDDGYIATQQLDFIKYAIITDGLTRDEIITLAENFR